MTAVLGYLRQWLVYSWYAMGLAFVTACWVTGDRYLQQAMMPPQDALVVWRALKPRWRTSAGD
jgi:hypothetical protein